MPVRTVYAINFFLKMSSPIDNLSRLIKNRLLYNFSVGEQSRVR